MNLTKLKKHIKLCRKNLKDDRTKCCAECPFEDEIVSVYPELSAQFKKKRDYLEQYKSSLKKTIKMSKRIPNLGVRCKECGVGVYVETSAHDDMDGVLHCIHDHPHFSPAFRGKR